MESKKSLSGRQALFVAAYVRGTSAVQAAKQAGYGPAYADGASKYLLPQPAIKSAIDAARSQLQKTTAYGLQEAVAEIDAFVSEVRGDKQPNRVSIVKALELKAKLHGLLVERVRLEEHVDFSGDLLAARERTMGDRETVLRQLERLAASGAISAQDVARATRSAPVDVPYAMVPRPVDPFSL